MEKLPHRWHDCIWLHVECLEEGDISMDLYKNPAVTYKKKKNQNGTPFVYIDLRLVDYGIYFKQSQMISI